VDKKEAAASKDAENHDNVEHKSAKFKNCEAS